jgi:hypothetical protein
MNEKPKQPQTYRTVVEKGGKTFRVEIADKSGVMRVDGFRNLRAADAWIAEQMKSDAEIERNTRTTRNPPPKP